VRESITAKSASWCRDTLAREDFSEDDAHKFIKFCRFGSVVWIRFIEPEMCERQEATAKFTFFDLSRRRRARQDERDFNEILQNVPAMYKKFRCLGKVFPKSVGSMENLFVIRRIAPNTFLCLINTLN
jgi:hypothetical protein